MRLRLVKEPFDNPDYIFELKHDGFRALAYVDAKPIKLDKREPHFRLAESAALIYSCCFGSSEAAGRTAASASISRSCSGLMKPTRRRGMSVLRTQAISSISFLLANRLSS